MKLETYMDEDGIFELQKNKDKKYLCNFTAEIIGETESYDSSNKLIDRLYSIKMKLKDKVKEFDISERDFSYMNWPNKQIGSGAMIYPGPNNKELIKLAIQSNSSDKKITKELCVLGFNKGDNRNVFIHGKGVIAPKDMEITECITVNLPENLRLNELPLNDDEDRLKDALTKCLSIFNLGNDNTTIGTILLSAPFRSVLTEFQPNIVSSFILGDTGSRKSSGAAISQSFFGPEYCDKTLPLHLVSTPTGISLVAQESKNTLLVADDYYPSPNSKNNEADKFIEQVVFASATVTARATGKSATQLADASAMNTLIMITGEVPLLTDKDSRHARVMYCPVELNTISLDQLSECQEFAKNGDFSFAMRLFIQRVVDSYDKLKELVPKKFIEYRYIASKLLNEQDDDLHARSASNAADIMLGVYYFLDFCKKHGVITKDKHSELIERSWNDIIELARTQDTIHTQYTPAAKIERAIACLLNDREFHLLDIKTEGKPSILNVGWVNKKPQGDLLGYVDTDKKKVYIKSNFNVQLLFNKLPRGIKRLLRPESKTFWKDMREFGLIVDHDNDRRNTKTINGVRYYYLNLPSIFE